MFSLAKRLIVIGALFLMHAAFANAACPEVGLASVEPGGTRWITTTSDIVDIRLEAPRYGEKGDVNVLIKFTPEADQRLHDATTNRSGMRIHFLFNDDVLLNIIWEGPYGMYTGGAQLSIQNGMDKGRKLIEAIKGCTKGTVIDATR